MKLLARSPLTGGIKMLLLLVCALAVAACASILGIRPTDESHPFEHKIHVDKGINCVVCHAGIEQAGETGPLHLPPDALCRSCHQKPHDERSCRTCHGEAYIREGAQLAREHLRFDHVKHGPAVHGDCVRCHTAVAESRPDTLRPKMATCFGCHQHADQWTLRDCQGCHVDLNAEDQAPESHLVHDGDWLREHGVRAASERDVCASCHTERGCAKCHGVGTTPTLPWKLDLGEVPLAGLHRAGFRARHALEARADPGICTTCHSESSCVDCHNASHVSPGGTTRSPHPAGWLSPGRGGGEHGPQARIDPASCAGCHGGAGEQLCVGCHKVGAGGGNPHGPGFASTKNKTHDLPCRLCHGAGA
jgi:predicted CXXCH cytochrome family protein